MYIFVSMFVRYTGCHNTKLAFAGKEYYVNSQQPTGWTTSVGYTIVLLRVLVIGKVRLKLPPVV